MKVQYKQYSIEIADDDNYTLNSADNNTRYDLEHCSEDAGLNKFYPMAKYGIRVSDNGRELASAIVAETGAALSIREHSFAIKDDIILGCCCDTIYALSIPRLKLIWKKQLDMFTCFGIYPFKGDFVIHGELLVSRMDIQGNILWEFGARDIFVTLEGKEAFMIDQDLIRLRDFEGYEYVLNEKGEEIG